MSKKRYVAIAGTWSRDGAAGEADWWCRPGSPFDKKMNEKGFTRLVEDDREWWDGALEGTTIQALYPGKKVNAKWIIGGGRIYAACRYEILSDDPPETITLIGHSHGGQAAVYAVCLLNHHLPEGWQDTTKVNLITIDTPVATSMPLYYKTATAAIDGRWLHLASKFFTKIRILGTGAMLRPWELFKRGMPSATNVNTGLGHSNLTHVDHLHWWEGISLEDPKSSTFPTKK